MVLARYCLSFVLLACWLLMDFDKSTSRLLCLLPSAFFVSPISAFSHMCVQLLSLHSLPFGVSPKAQLLGQATIKLSDLPTLIDRIATATESAKGPIFAINAWEQKQNRLLEIVQGHQSSQVRASYYAPCLELVSFKDPQAITGQCYDWILTDVHFYNRNDTRPTLYRGYPKYDFSIRSRPSWHERRSHRSPLAPPQSITRICIGYCLSSTWANW